MGSAGSVLKVEEWGGGVCCALRSKNWKKEDCFSLSLEKLGSHRLFRDCGRDQRLSAALTEKQGTQGGRTIQRTSSGQSLDCFLTEDPELRRG